MPFSSPKKKESAYRPVRVAEHDITRLRVLKQLRTVSTESIAQHAYYYIRLWRRKGTVEVAGCRRVTRVQWTRIK